MGRKLFVSYKYHDTNVFPLSSHDNYGKRYYKPTTVRSYVDILENYCDKTDHIYKAESNDEDLSCYSEETIWQKLRDRIFDSSVTIVMISAGMKDPNKSDIQQWIPWEIAFSLKETTRSDKKSHTNAILAVILPDYNGGYEYFLSAYHCCTKGCIIFNTNILFSILRENMFNRINMASSRCQNGKLIYTGNHSYITFVLWKNFTQNPNFYIEKAIKIKENASLYAIRKEV